MDESETESNNGHEGVEGDLASGEVSSVVCPECEGKIIYDENLGERTCEKCGLVVVEEPMDYGPEWRAFYHEEESQKSRVGTPSTPLMHDKGLSTTIGWQDKDASGKTVSARKRARLQRLRTWDERFRTKNAHERNLKQALGEIDRMASALGLPDSVRETAAVLYRRAVDEGLLPGRSIEEMATASLYAAARQHGTPRTLVEFTIVCRVERLRVQRAYRYLSRKLDLRIEPADPLQYTRQFASILEVSDEAERMARDLLHAGEAQDVHSGKSPAGLAAAALYAAAQLTNEHLTQEMVSDATHISHVTIRDRYRELLDAYAEGK